MNPHKHRKPNEPITASHIQYDEEVRERWWRLQQYKLFKPVIHKLKEMMQ